MNREITQPNISANRDMNANGAPAGLDAEIRNQNNEVEQTVLNSAAEINRLVEGVPSGTSPTAPVTGLEVITETPQDLEIYFTHLENPSVRNADNDLLGALRSRGVCVGFVDEVNGPGAEEFHTFVPTRNELLQLVKYWAKIAVDIDYFWFCYQQPGSREIRLEPFAWRRINRIAALLGNEAVAKAIDEAYAEYGKNQDPRVWNIFLNGTDEEREALREELDRKMQEHFAEAERSEARGRENADPVQGGTNEESSELKR